MAAVTIVHLPGTVPKCAMPKGSSGGQQDNRIGFETEVGPPIERPRATWVPEIYNISLPLITLQAFRDFKEWFESDLGWGVNAFVFKHPITGDDGVWKIMPTSPPYQVSKPLLNSTMPGFEQRKCIQISFTIMSINSAVPS